MTAARVVGPISPGLDDLGTEVPDGFLPYVQLAWGRVPEYERDADGQLVKDPRTRQVRFVRLTDRWRARAVGWPDQDPDGRVWVLG